MRVYTKNDILKRTVIISSIISMILGLCFLPWGFAAIDIAVNIWLISSIFTKDKFTIAGIFGIIFTGIIPGVLYLCLESNKSEIID